MTNSTRIGLSLASLFILMLHNVRATDVPATATTLTVTNYFSDVSSGTACISVAGTLGGASGVPACTGAATNDSWYQFTATTQAIRVNVTTTNFDAVVELLEAGSLNSLECENSNGANSGEILRYNALTEGETYLIRVHSAAGGGGTFNVCAQSYPAAFINEINSPFPNSDDQYPGYKIAQNISRMFIGPNNIIQATRWFFTDIDTGDEIIAIANSGSTNLNLNTVDGICFGRTYDVKCEIRTEDFWCGVSITRPIQMEMEPYAVPQPSINGNTYALGSNISAVFMGSGQQFEWRFTTDNGSTIFTQFSNGNSSIVFFGQTPCLRYNRIYSVEVRATYCDLTGPWSDPLVFFTPSVPYNALRNQYCGTSLAPNGFVQTNFAPSATGYIWQFAPIEHNDPNFVPIGPAVVTTGTSTGLFLGPLGLSNGTSYRVAVKNVYADCGLYQEGDYGEFCQITIGTPAGLQSRMTEDEIIADVERQIEEQLGISLYPNPMSGQLLNMEIDGVEASELAQLEVFDLNGRMVYADQVVIGGGSNWFQMEFPSSLTNGTYMVSLRTDNHVFTSRFVKAAL